MVQKRTYKRIEKTGKLKGTVKAREIRLCLLTIRVVVVQTRLAVLGYNNLRKSGF